jgi:hypothetical protein
MIIGFAGRMRSGKTELAKICEKYGFEKLYFALPLKQLCADILDISIDGLNKAKNEGTDISLYLGDDICTILSEETDIPLSDVRETCYGKTLHNVREMLQFIGTDLIRKYNKDWHVNRIREMIDPNKDYVLDDVRFPNEKELIEELGGDCWFVTRTAFDNVSNHESETSITWHHCWNRIIINDGTLHYLTFRWNSFMANYTQSRTIRDKEFNRILEHGFTNVVPNMVHSDISTFDMLMLPKCLFDYVPIDINKDDVDEIKMLESGDVQIKYKDGTSEIVTNELAIEDLKMLL